MIDSIEKDLEQYLQTHPELSDFGYTDAYNNGNLIGIISAKDNMKTHEKSYNELEERLSLKDDERAYTSLFWGLVKSAVFAVVGSIPVLGVYYIHNSWQPDINSEIRELDVKCQMTEKEDNWGRNRNYLILEVNATAFDADGDEIDLSIHLDNGVTSETIVTTLPPYEISADSKTQYFYSKAEGFSSMSDGDVLIAKSHTSAWSEDDSKNTILDCD